MYIYVGNVQGKVVINVPNTIPSGQPASGNCTASGKVYSRMESYCYMRAKLVDYSNEEHCSIKHIGRFHKLSEAQYQQKFNITCNNNGNEMIGIKCFTCANEIAQTLVLGESKYYTY